jgi:hypothetical protein
MKKNDAGKPLLFQEEINKMLAQHYTTHFPKNLTDYIGEYAKNQIESVFALGENKYGFDNFLNKPDILRIFNAFERHMYEIKKAYVNSCIRRNEHFASNMDTKELLEAIDVEDDESNIPHIVHAICSLLMILKIYNAAVNEAWLLTNTNKDIKEEDCVIAIEDNPFLPDFIRDIFIKKRENKQKEHSQQTLFDLEAIQ